MMCSSFSMCLQLQEVYLCTFSPFTSEFDLFLLLWWSSGGRHSQFPAGTECSFCSILLRLICWFHVAAIVYLLRTASAVIKLYSLPRQVNPAGGNNIRNGGKDLHLIELNTVFMDYRMHWIIKYAINEWSIFEFMSNIKNIEL